MKEKIQGDHSLLGNETQNEIMQSEINARGRERDTQTKPCGTKIHTIERKKNRILEDRVENNIVNRKKLIYFPNSHMEKCLFFLEFLLENPTLESSLFFSLSVYSNESTQKI